MAVPDIRKVAAASKVPVGTIEKDVALTILLSRLSKSGLAARTAFKGGTAIKMLHFPGARFSEDLDFTLLGVDPKEVKKEVRLMTRAPHGTFAFGELTEVRSTPDSLLFRVPFTGPLDHRDSVRFDFSRREKPLRPLESLPVKDLYGILEDEARVQALALPEIFAEKVRALLQTGLPRHLYDLWFLLRERPGLPDPGLIEGKLAPHGLSLDEPAVDRALARVEPVWKRDLEPFLARLPDFSPVAKDVKAGLLLRSP